ncbi:ABC transporter ATP-binding protein [Acidimicrobiia bacterium EGI L10123]|uniref:ABC transporter ATP-binding protein n=1 Tax=Salinilacustrithrix flava TaxID=2957203 RepID=UPI003D7C1D57|nr:ABC transporter ATP-binding protein [Acidimicrobiia bacterium EGI L10123]
MVRVLHGIDLEVRDGEVVVVLGANGAGKTTTMRAICGLVDTTGSIRLDGKEIVGKKSADVARLGVAHVPQGRGTFADLSVEDNLQVGAFVRKDKEIRSDIDRWYEVFPVLGERRQQQAGTLSGGEQQMLAVARALMGRPRLLLLDEPSLGLAPMIVQNVFRNLQSIREEFGTTMLVVEQNANLALGIADRGYVIEAGRIVLSGTADELSSDDAVRAAYLGY